MNKLYLLIALFMFLNNVYAEEFNIEETNLKALPNSVESVVRNSKKFAFAECNLIGKAVNLSDSNNPFEYIITTEPACGWGASAAPVWVVAKINGTYAVLLETTTTAVETIKNKNHGLHQLVETSGTAGHASYTRWGFNGKNYKKLEGYVFLPDDEKLCKAHRDICPFEVGQ
ncbi:MAG TPA: hypothetical protein DCO68_12125 [Methylophilaceae bacterium]|nr:hypothetical protein [Methylophilaceae bacterium]HAJ72812.1 hypothetical protein [Methylophilaceae bacterium]